MQHKDEHFHIVYLPTVRLSLQEIASFHRRLGHDHKPIIAKALDEFESRVSQFPLGCQICSELAELGVTRYREFNSSDGYRVLFSVEQKNVYAHVFLSQRQSIQQLLFRRLIEH